MKNQRKATFEKDCGIGDGKYQNIMLLDENMVKELL